MTDPLMGGLDTLIAQLSAEVSRLLTEIEVRDLRIAELESLIDLAACRWVEPDDADA
jgi:hypothetical protein